MTLLDTNVLIYASDLGSRYHFWATAVIGDPVSSAGAAVNAVSLAEACVGSRAPEAIAARIGVRFSTFPRRLRFDRQSPTGSTANEDVASRGGARPRRRSRISSSALMPK